MRSPLRKSWVPACAGMTRAFFATILLLAWSSVALCEQPITATISTVDGSQLVGELVDWTTQAVSLKQADQLATFSPKELLRLEFQSPRKASISSEMRVGLIDGSRFLATSFEVTDHKAILETPFSTVPLTISTDQIQFIEFPNARKATQTWLAKWEQKDLTGDVLVLFKKDSAEVDFLSGVLNDISATEVNFTWEGETIPVKLSKIAAITYYHAQPKDVAEPLCWLSLGNGSRLPAAQIDRDAETLRVTTVLGNHLQIPLHEITTADYSIGKLAYLSDMPPLREEWTPLIGLPTLDKRVKQLGMPRRDTSFEGTPLTLAWPADDDVEGILLKAYPKGLALRSRTELEYRIPRGMRRFVASAGIDPETASQGKVLLSIVADGETLFEDSIAGSEAPINIDLIIDGKKKLQILVDYGANLDLGDRLHLVEARLIK